MTYRLVLHPEVWRDIGNIRERYGVISSRLFNEFGSQLAGLLDRIGEHPRMYAEVEARYRRANLSRFPYQVFYTIAGDRVWLLAIFHSHTDPQATMRRIAGRESGSAAQ